MPRFSDCRRAAWSRRASPQTTLWFWNTELGWATVHPLLLAQGWEFRNCHIWDKGKGQPVTEADLAIDKFLRETLTIARPTYGWMSEESEDDPSRREAEHTFIVDPIDGTTAFLKGRPWFTIAIAIVRDGRPEQGVVYNPITEECFAASRGAGAYPGAQCSPAVTETVVWNPVNSGENRGQRGEGVRSN